MNNFYIMNNLLKFLENHTMRGDCLCGQCIDTGDGSQPIGHTADLMFFKVALNESGSSKQQLKDDLLAAIKSDYPDLLDGQEHSYIEIGYWIGGQDWALRLMGACDLLGLMTLLTPRKILSGADESLLMSAAQSGFITVQKR